MFGKSIAILLGLGIMSIALLALRQKRYEVAAKDALEIDRATARCHEISG